MCCRALPHHPGVIHSASLVECQLAFNDTRLLVKKSIVIIFTLLVTSESQASIFV
jgi:hypothetical protein